MTADEQTESALRQTGAQAKTTIKPNPHQRARRSDGATNKDQFPSGNMTDNIIK